MPDAIITSTASTFGTITGTFAADQSTIVGTVAGSVVGTLTGSVGVPGPQGPTGPQGPIGPEGPPGEGGTWGSIVGDIEDQVDLWSELGSKYPASNPSGFITASALSPYLTTATANATFQTLAGMSSYLTTSAAAAGYYPLTGNPSGFLTAASLSGYATESWVTGQGYITSAALAGYAPLASPAFTGNPTAPTAALGDNDTSIATTAFVQQELLSGTANARNLEVYVRNQTGSTIPAGSIVYINGATGNRPTITLAQANNDANSAQTFGFTKAAIANNGFGFVIVRGELENIDTSALTEGVQLYLSPTTPGTWTTTKPSAPQHLVYVGICVRAHPTQGVILVAIQNGYEVGEIHDIQLGTLANNDLLAYESSTDLWKNKSFGTLGLLTSSSLTGYATESFVTSQGYLTDAPSDGNQYARKDGAWDVVSAGSSYITSVTLPLSVTSGDLSVDLNGYATEAWVYSQGYETTANAAATYLSIVDAATGYYPLTGNPSGFITSAALSTYAPLASPALTGNVTITSNSTGAALFIVQSGSGNILTLHDQASDTTFVAIDQNGKVNTIPSTTASAGFNVPHATAAPTTPVNGDVWTTTSGLFMRQNGSTQQYVDFGGTQTISGAKTFSNANQTLGNSTAAGTINVGTGATISGATKAVNLGTSGVAGSTTNITIGSTTGTSTTTFNGNIGGNFTLTGNTIVLGNSAANGSAVFVGNGIITTGTKNVQIGTGGQAGSTTNINIGTTSGGTSNISLQGTVTANTAAADTNSSVVASTAYVVGQAGSATPLVNGTAAVGTSLRYARQDHVHGTDTTRAPLASPTFTGTPLSTTAAVDTNTTQIATTAYVVGQGYLKSATASTTYAPLASPALTGTPTAPTATAGTNTTQIATTAFVTAALPALATASDSRQFTNDTKAMSPRDVLWSMLSQDFVDINGSAMTVTNTGTITSVQVGQLSRAIRPSNAGACSSRIRTFGTSQVDQTWTASSRAQPSSFLNFSLRSIHSGRSTTSGVTDANYTCAVYYGKAEADGTGDLIRRGYGWKMVGGAGSRFLQLQAHNGTTLSSVTSSFAVTAGVAFDWDIESDGAGNVTLYVNGSSVATSTGGPTGAVNITGVAWQEEVVAAAALSSPFMDFVNSRGRYIVINTW